MKSIILILGFIILLVSSSISQLLRMDQTFGQKGVVSLPKQSWNDEVNSKVIEFQKSLYLLHGLKNTQIDNRLKLVIVKMDYNGHLDQNYFDNGFNITTISLDTINGFEFRRQMILFQPTQDDKILVFSTMKNSKISGQNASLCFKIDFEGRIDTTFGDNGYLWSYGHHSVSSSQFITDNEGNIYIVAMETDKISNLYFIEVTKYSPQGIKITNYSTHGSLLINVNSTNVPKLAINDLYELFISNTLDSVIVIYSYNTMGDPNLKFGLDGYLKFSNFLNRLEHVRKMVIHEDFIFLFYSGTQFNQGKEEGIIKINGNGDLENSFGIDGLLKMTDTTNPNIEFLDFFVIGDNLIGLGRGDINNNGSHSAIVSLEGNIKNHWTLNYDSLSFRPFPFSHSLNNSEIYAVGKYKDPSISSNHIVILNLILDKTTSMIDHLCEGNFILFPNPAENFINLEQSRSISTQYFIYSAEGKLMDGLILNNLNERSNISVENYPPGLYWIKAYNSRVNLNKSFIKL